MSLYKQVLEIDIEHHKRHKDDAEKELQKAKKELADLKERLKGTEGTGTKRSGEGGSSKQGGGEGIPREIPEIEITLADNDQSEKRR